MRETPISNFFNLSFCVHIYIVSGMTEDQRDRMIEEKEWEIDWIN